MFAQHSDSEQSLAAVPVFNRA